MREDQSTVLPKPHDTLGCLLSHGKHAKNGKTNFKPQPQKKAKSNPRTSVTPKQ